MTYDEKVNWCINKHRETNHYYDKYLPYEFHLRMVVQAAKDFMYMIDESMREDILLACWGHDLIEDARCSYNDCLKMLTPASANIIYAVTNEKGRNRKERANAEYYRGIRNTLGAVFVKLCDRIANVQYSKMTKSNMADMYEKENEHFVKSLCPDDAYSDIVDYLNNLIKS